jgi:hypothetical protein
MMVPNGPGISASAQWRDIRPELSPEPYVFAAHEPPYSMAAATMLLELHDSGIHAV